MKARWIVAILGIGLFAGAACSQLPSPTEEVREAEHIAEVLRLSGGETVADVGAGDGEITIPLARRVGPTGHAYATEIDASLLTGMAERFASAGITHITPLLGDERDTGLAPGCCDAALLRKVYHHFVDPKAMSASLLAALKPGGRLAVIEYSEHLSSRVDGVPENRSGHGLAMALLIEELTAAGFEVVSTHPEWMGRSNQYCVVFRRP